MERIVKGIWIPIEIWQDSDLSWNEKILLMEIDSFTSKGKDCYISNEYIAKLLGVTSRWASQCLSHLIDRNLVKVTSFDGRVRMVESNLTSFQAEWKKTSRQSGAKLPHTDNNITDNNVVDKSTTVYKREAAFVKPTIEEVRAYCRERGNCIDAEAFIAHYESNGWMVGRNKMKNWRQAVITWEKSHIYRKSTLSQPPPQKESVLEHNLKVADRMISD